MKTAAICLLTVFLASSLFADDPRPHGPKPQPGDELPPPPPAAEGQNRNRPDEFKGTGLPPPDFRESRNFRGRRVPDVKDAFSILNIKSGKIKNGVISIDVFFNQGINPLSVKTSNIYINGEQLKESAGYMFSRNGNTLRLTFVAPEGDFSVKIENIESFKGDKLAPAEFTGINEGSSVTIKPVSGDGGTKDDKNSHN